MKCIVNYFQNLFYFNFLYKNKNDNNITMRLKSSGIKKIRNLILTSNKAFNECDRSYLTMLPGLYNNHWQIRVWCLVSWLVEKSYIREERWIENQIQIWLSNINEKRNIQLETI